MSIVKKIFLGIGITLATLVVLFLVVIGPWPVYKDAHYLSSSYYKQALADIDKNVQASQITDKPGPLKAGWATRVMTPRVGVPMAGYGSRKGKPSKGVRDDLNVKALVLSDGVDTVAICGSDMLLVPPNVADLVRAEVAKQTPLNANNILFTASHTHYGIGGWGPGLAGWMVGGKYDPSIPPFLAEAFSGAIVDAYNKMKPAKLAHGTIDASKYIHNRARKAPVDGDLSFMLLEQEGGQKCYTVRFSAHPTTLDDMDMEFSAEYPGELQRYIERTTGVTAIYIGGSLGSSSPSSPEAPNASAKVEALGQTLAKLVLDNSQNLEYRTNLDIASVGIPVGMPQFQMRPMSPKWRVSPIAGKVLGVPSEGWMQGVRVGDLLFIGVPFDFSGELSIEWKQWAKEKGYDLWPSSFCAGYCGYLSPDKYYNDVDGKGLGYEVGFMNWFGPNTGEYITDLFQHMTQALGPAQKQAAAAQ
jgi:hypothetical protein